MLIYVYMYVYISNLYELIQVECPAAIVRRSSGDPRDVWVHLALLADGTFAAGEFQGGTHL